MINPEFFVFDAIADEIRVEFPGIKVIGEVAANPAQFPTVTIIEIDNRVYQRMRNLTIENAADVTYEVNVYTNTVGTKKIEAKKIMESIDSIFERIGFTRILCEPIFNMQDVAIYRMVARYQGIVDRDLWVYQS